MNAVRLEAEPVRVEELSHRQAPTTRARRWLRRPAETATLAAYVALVGFGVANHAPWADEIQSWLLARDLSPAGLAVHQLRYEGSPGLWQMVLWPFAHVHLPLIALNLVAASVAVLGVAILLFASPLPLALRVALPFTFFLAFQYAVIARPYVLLPPLVFALALAFPSRFRHPVLFTLLLCLIAGVSVQMMLAAGSIFLVFFIDSFRQIGDRREFDQQFRWAFVLFVSVQVILAAVLWPTSDNAFAHGLFFVKVGPFLRGLESILIGNRSFTPFDALNVLLLLALGTWLYSKQLLRYFLIPYVAYALVGAVMAKGGPWLDGFGTLLLVFGLWIAWGEPQRRSTSPFPRMVLPATLALTVFVLAVQLTWSASAFSWTSVNPYGPGKATGQYLIAHHLVGYVIASDGDYWAIDVEPYLPLGRFVNLPTPGAFYHWSKSVDFDNAVFTPIIDKAAQVIIAGPREVGMTLRAGTSKRNEPRFAGYRIITVIPSGIFWPGTKNTKALGLYIFLRDDLTLPTVR